MVQYFVQHFFGGFISCGMFIVVVVVYWKHSCWNPAAVMPLFDVCFYDSLFFCFCLMWVYCCVRACVKYVLLNVCVKRFFLFYSYMVELINTCNTDGMLQYQQFFFRLSKYYGILTRSFMLDELYVRGSSFKWPI